MSERECVSMDAWPHSCQNTHGLENTFSKRGLLVQFTRRKHHLRWGDERTQNPSRTSEKDLQIATIIFGAPERTRSQLEKARRETRQI